MSDAMPETAPLNRRFAENLIALRKRAGLSQVHVAERAGLHRTQLSDLECGVHLPRLDTIVRLGGALEVEPCVLLAGMAWRLGSVRQIGGYAQRNAGGGSTSTETG